MSNKHKIRQNQAYLTLGKDALVWVNYKDQKIPLHFAKASITLMDVVPIETTLAQATAITPPVEAIFSAIQEPDPTVSKDAIRTSLRASTLDGVFAAIFSNITGGVLLSNVLVELNASTIEIGMLSSIPMLANLLQPLGAYLADRTTSRHWYCLWI